MSGLRVDRMRLSVQSGSFYFIEHKKRDQSPAIMILLKIEDVIKRRFSYCNPYGRDTFSNLSEPEIFFILKKMAAHHNRRTSRKRIYHRILKCFPRALSLPFDPITNGKIIEYFDISNLNQLARLNHDGSRCAEKAMVQQARKWRYSGSDPLGAKHHLQELFKQVSFEFKPNFPFCGGLRGVCPQPVQALVSKCLGIDPLNIEKDLQALSSLDQRARIRLKYPETILQKLKELQPLDIIEIGNCKRFYDEDYKLIREIIFCDRPSEKKIAPTSFVLTVLKGVIKENKKNMLEFILKTFELGPKALQEQFLSCLRQGSMELGKLFIRYGVPIEKTSRALNMACGDTQPFMQSFDQDIELVRFLLKYIDPMVRSDNGSYSIHFAAQRGFLEAVQLLFKHGVKLNLPGGKGCTPLGFACGFGDWPPQQKVVVFLLENGADPNRAVDPLEGGEYPLHFAVKRGYIAIVKLLLEYKADPEVRDVMGKTPFMLAQGLGRHEIMALFQ